MKHNLCFRGFGARNLRFAAALSCSLFFAAAPAGAQVIVPPTQPDKVFTTSNPGTDFINTDMLNTSSGPLKAFAWFPTSSGSAFGVEDGMGNFVIIPLNGKGHPDVALADDMNNPGINYKLGVVYDQAGAYLEVYNITGVGTPSLSVNLVNTVQLNSSGSSALSFPFHIDIFADPSNLINGLPSMHQFIISWVERSGNVYSLKAAYGDIANPATFTTATVTSSTVGILSSDVAASYNTHTGQKSAYLTYEGNPGDVHFAQLDEPSGIVTTTYTLTGSSSSLPRIEAMGLYDPGVSHSPWFVAASMYNGGTGSSSDVWGFDQDHLSGFICATPFYSPATNLDAVVAAGLGTPYSGFCNDHYVVGWGMESSSPGDSIYTRVIDYNNGSISTLYPDFYQVNSDSGTVRINPPASPISVSSCSNSGQQLLVAWTNEPTGIIYYKLVNDVTGFKPTDIPVVQEEEGHLLTLYPNPATEQLTVNGLTAVMHYKITGIAGRELTSGTITQAHPVVDIHVLSPGMYVLNLMTPDGRSQKMKFVKK